MAALRASKMGPGLRAGFKVTLVVGGTCSGEEIAFWAKRRTSSGTTPSTPASHPTAQPHPRSPRVR